MDFVEQVGCVESCIFQVVFNLPTEIGDLPTSYICNSNLELLSKMLNFGLNGVHAKIVLVMASAVANIRAAGNARFNEEAKSWDKYVNPIVRMLDR